MRKLFGNILIVLVLLALLDWATGAGLDWLRDNSPDGRYYKIKYSLDSCREDIVIIGSSRGEINYIPKILEDSLGLSCWNASRGGQGTPYFRAIQEGILKRYTPKLVILNVDDNDLELPPNYEHAGVLRPFYKSNEEIRPILDMTSTFENLLMKSRLYAYNSSFYYLIRPYFVPGLDGRTIDKGWKPRLGKMSVDLVDKMEIVREKLPLDPESTAMLDLFIERFKARGSQIILVVSPNYGRLVDSSSAIRYLREKSRIRQIPLFVYSGDTSFVSRTDFFIDPDHLNTSGAEIFTKNLVQKIKPVLDASLAKGNDHPKIAPVVPLAKAGN
jgi:hypothetical protein